MAIKIFEDLAGLGVKDILDIYAGINQANIDKGIAKSNQQLQEWQAQGILAMQKAQAAMPLGSLTPSGTNPVYVIGAVLVVAALGYVVLAKVK